MQSIASTRPAWHSHDAMGAGEGLLYGRTFPRTREKTNF